VGWKAKDRGLWLTLAALTALLVVLAALQYRWTSEIGRAEAERRQTQLERSTWRFASAFDRETGRLLRAFFRMETHPPGGDPRALLLERLAAWRRDEHAALLSAVVLATRAPSGVVTLETCGAGDAAFHELPWTNELEPLRQRLQATKAGRDGFFVRPGSLLDHPLALAFPLVDAGSGEPHAERWGRFRVTGMVLLQLDQDYLGGQLFPQLAEAHFGPVAESEFVVAVARRGDRSVVFSTDPAHTGVLAPQPGDVQRSLPGRGRVGPDRRAPDPGPHPGERAPEDGPAAEGRRPPDEESPWLLVARHRGGSLEDAVTRVRRRNLAVGFGVLALLGATAALLATGAQRARRLARQQMEFVAGVTHELNTPLAAIRSAGQNLADGIVTDAAQVRRYGGLIEKEGGRLTALVAQVLDFAGIESGSRAYVSEPLAVVTLVDEVLRDHRLALDQAGMTVERDLPPDLPQVRGDSAALRRVLDNLVANAVKFAASGRWLAVRAASRPDRGAVVLRVEDRGPGIPRDERERVFAPFFRGPAAERNATPGSGLGLSLVRHVVRAHGGRVWVEGHEGGGAAVVLELPVAAGGEKQP
jgi:signal transduction histidine kinase